MLKYITVWKNLYLVPPIHTGWVVTFCKEYKSVLTRYTVYVQYMRIIYVYTYVDTCEGSQVPLCCALLYSCVHTLSSVVLYCRLYFGTRPFLIVSDPDLLKEILIKNFDKFQNRIVSYFLSLCWSPCASLFLGASRICWLNSILDYYIYCLCLRLFIITINRMNVCTVSVIL